MLSLAADDIAEQWDAAVRDMAAAISMLRDECGVLVSKWLPYRPMLIPLAAAWRTGGEAAGPGSGSDAREAEAMVLVRVFTGEYESSSATLAERDSPVLRAGSPEANAPPVVRDFAWDPERWRAITAASRASTEQRSRSPSPTPRDFHTAAPLTPEVIEAEKIDDHHVFPRGFLQDLTGAPKPTRSSTTP